MAIDLPTSVRSVPLCNRHEFILDRCAGKRVLSIGLGGQTGTAVDYSFNLDHASDLSWTISARIAEAASHSAFVDILPEAIDRFKPVLTDSDFYLANITDPIDTWPEGLAAERFETVVVGEVLEHLDNPGAALRGLNEVLSDDGRIVITVPNAFSLANAARVFFGEEDVHPEHVAYYSPKTLDRLLSMSGFESVEIGFYRTRPLALSQLRDNAKGYVAGAIAERVPQVARGIVASARRSG